MGDESAPLKSACASHVHTPLFLWDEAPWLVIRSAAWDHARSALVCGWTESVESGRWEASLVSGRGKGCSRRRLWLFRQDPLPGFAALTLIVPEAPTSQPTPQPPAGCIDREVVRARAGVSEQGSSCPRSAGHSHLTQFFPGLPSRASLKAAPPPKRHTPLTCWCRPSFISHLL
jgi:hypothetical protein